MLARHRQRWAVSLVLIGLLPLLACDRDSNSDLVPGVTDANGPGRLAYFAIEEDSVVVVIQDIETGDQIRVPLEPEVDGYWVAWFLPLEISPDGTRFAFVRGDPNGGWQLRIIGADGDDEHGLRVGFTDSLGVWRDTAGGFGAPRWSPDGDRLAFESDDGGLQTTLFVAGADGADPVALFDPPDGASDNFDSQFAIGVVADPWSPDGGSLAFTRLPENFRSGNDPSFDHVGVYTTSLSDPVPILLSDPSEIAFFQSWSPDGAEILYVVFGRELENDIRVMNADGTDHRTIGKGWSPEWSPDGRHVLFRSTPDADLAEPHLALYRVRADGSERTRITDESGNDGLFGVAWSLDSRYVAFTHRNGERFELWIVTADGSDPQIISPFAAWPVWLP